ncbi:hypothetical protein EMCG_07123 [[Emmonsia] crescens]|uniref:Uncharacterized protein n=1 Tax=[Emmonsia] crescens TaxID=73230 RepID=A0A0G2I9G5_9EURO|nr:hypothetical protein EMCG_07123 [Emmonsia crescens UAMH 3008]
MNREKKQLGADDFEKAVKMLDREIGKNELLIAFAPITLLSAGGFLAVNYLKNRESTMDLDYFLEPQWAHDDDIRMML